jgi:soluble lytic murein transglycosylase-like protein
MNRKYLLIAALVLGAMAMFTFTSWSIPPLGRKFAELFQRAEYTHGVPTHLIARMAQQESNYDPDARSSAGALGIMQIIPRWHPTVNPLDPAAAIDYAGALIRRHYDRFGTWSKALAAYNAGPTRLASEISEAGLNWLAQMPAETQDYIARITADVRVS